MKLEQLATIYDSVYQNLASDDCSNNGLQVEASDEIHKVAFAVDACLDTFEKAARAGADLLVVHHGISWGGGLKRLDGYSARRLSVLFENHISLYAQHLPMDMHPVLGNNAVLSDILQIQERVPFFEDHGQVIGFSGMLPHPMTPAAIAWVLNDALDTHAAIPVDGHAPIHSIGIVSGGGADAIFDASRQKLDALLTGEFTHEFYHPASEQGLSVIAAGHYATETTGPRAIMKYTSQNTDLECVFIDSPTGL